MNQAKQRIIFRNRLRVSKNPVFTCAFVILFGLASNVCRGQMERYDAYEAKYLRSIDWTEDFLSDNASRKDFAVSMRMANSFPERVHAHWGVFYYDKIQVYGSDNNQDRSVLADFFSREFENAPDWWIASIRTVVLMKSGLLRFKPIKQQADESALIRLGDLKLVDGNIVSPEKGADTIPLSYLSFGIQEPLFATICFPRLDIDNVYVCVHDSNVSSKIRLWCITNKGRLRWMQIIDFPEARLMTSEIGSKWSKVAIEVLNKKIGDPEIHVYGVWEDSLFVCKFDAITGNPLFVFNSSSFPVRPASK
jgi:hypothetical protein